MRDVKPGDPIVWARCSPNARCPRRKWSRRLTPPSATLVERHLETLALMGEVTKDADGRYAASRKAAWWPPPPPLSIVLNLEYTYLGDEHLLVPDPAAELLLGKGRRELLALLFANAGRSLYLRELSRMTGGSPGTTQRELQGALEQVGLLVSNGAATWSSIGQTRTRRCSPHFGRSST